MGKAKENKVREKKKIKIKKKETMIF